MKEQEETPQDPAIPLKPIREFKLDVSKPGYVESLEKENAELRVEIKRLNKIIHG